MNDITAPQVWRTIVEWSCMQNNDEEVFYTDHRIEKASDLQLQSRPFERPSVMLSRQVREVEILAGLQLVRSRRWDRGEPECTVLIDALTRVVHRLQHHMEWVNPEYRTVSCFVSDEIACQFYDCMSGGVSRPWIQAMRWLIENYRVPNDVEVYPRGSGWTTIADFMDETKHVPPLEDLALAASVLKLEANQ